MSQVNLPISHSSALIVPFSTFSGINPIKIQELQKGSPADIPTSQGSSSGSIGNPFKKRTISPPTFGSHSRFQMRDEIASATLKPLRKKEKGRLAFYSNFDELDAEAPEPVEKERPEINTLFPSELYQRINDYLEQEGLDITIPGSNDDSFSKGAIRRLILARTVSEQAGIPQEDDLNIEEFGSAGLRKTISCSTLAKRRASSQSPSSKLEMDHFNQKKSNFCIHPEACEIIEEKETPSVSNRSSFIRRRSNRFGGLLSKEDNSSDLQSRNSRKSSQILPSCMASPQVQHVQSLCKLSPAVKASEFNVKTFKYLSPQTAFKKIPAQAMKTPFATMRMFREFETNPIIKDTVEIPSFGETISNSSEASTPKASGFDEN